jgi:D-threo-aldose 1-dehydrogenase
MMASERPWMRGLGSTGLEVSAVGAGGAPLGSMPENFGYEVSEDDAIDLVRAILESPIRFIDTSNGYSEGRSERRIGAGIAAAGALPTDLVVATKVDARDGDYSGQRVRESIRESKKRLGLEFLPLVYLHDPEFHDFTQMNAPGGAVEALVDLRADGEVGHLGLAGGDVHEMRRYLDLDVFEVVLIHNRWTIVDRSATDLIEHAARSDVAVVNAAVYGGGILANPHGSATSYGYRPVRPGTREAIRQMDQLASRWETTLATVALQWSLRDPRVNSTVIGFTKKSRLDSILASANHELPDEFWDQLEALVPERGNWLDYQ